MGIDFGVPIGAFQPQSIHAVGFGVGPYNDATPPPISSWHTLC
jgi:hypothetical protein